MQGLSKKDKIDCIGVDIKPSEFTTHVGSVIDRGFLRRVVKDIDFIIHAATLHKPHVAIHTTQDFVDTNISGTLNLLEESLRQNIKGFIYTSTTSTFGDVLSPVAGQPAVWVTESTTSIPKNIYGVTKSAAEDLCQLFYRNHKLPCIILKTSRFFPEEDDKGQIRENYEDLNIKAIEYLYRRVDIEDAVSAHLLALESVQRIGFRKYIISATTPFQETDLIALNSDANSVVKRYYPDFESLFKKKAWKMLPQIDRVYVNERARIELGWKPKYSFAYILDCIRINKNHRSQLSLDVGKKGYHDKVFDKGPYPVND